MQQILNNHLEQHSTCKSNKFVTYMNSNIRASNDRKKSTSNQKLAKISCRLHKKSTVLIHLIKEGHETRFWCKILFVYLYNSYMKFRRKYDLSFNFRFYKIRIN